MTQTTSLIGFNAERDLLRLARGLPDGWAGSVNEANLDLLKAIEAYRVAMKPIKTPEFWMVFREDGSIWSSYLTETEAQHGATMVGGYVVHYESKEIPRHEPA